MKKLIKIGNQSNEGERLIKTGTQLSADKRERCMPVGEIAGGCLGAGFCVQRRVNGLFGEWGMQGETRVKGGGCGWLWLR